MTASNVVKLKIVDGAGPGLTVKANRVLAGARQAKLAECVVIGMDAEGDLYTASTHGPADTILLLEFAKFWLFSNSTPE